MNLLRQLRRQYRMPPQVPFGYCPNHATGVKLPNIEVTPLQYVE